MTKKAEQLQSGTQSEESDLDYLLGTKGKFKLPERKRVSTEIIINQEGLQLNLEGQSISPSDNQKPSSAPQLPEKTES